MRSDVGWRLPLRVVRHLLAERWLCAAGGIGGVLLARWLVDVIVGLNATAVPRLTETTLDVGVMAVAAAISIGTALLFGVGPAIALCSTNVQETLKDEAGACRRRVACSPRPRDGDAASGVDDCAVAGAGLMFKSVADDDVSGRVCAGNVRTMRIHFAGRNTASSRPNDLRHRSWRRRKAFLASATAPTTPGVIRRCW